MIKLAEVTEDNWIEVAGLSVDDRQKKFLAPPVGILARAYVYRNCNANVRVIVNDETIVGLAMTREFTDEPLGYELQQFMIDKRYQDQGFGTEALKLILDELRTEGHYDHVEVCVKMDDTEAIHLYNKVGFVDSGYIDEDAPDSYNLVCNLSIRKKLELRKCNTDIEKEWAFVRDMPEEENGLTNSLHGISRQEFEEKALPEMLKHELGLDMPDWMVPETILYLWDGDEIAGQFRIRHYLTEALRNGAGHIGYFIAKEHRVKGYGTEGLKQTLAIAKELVKEEEFYLRVNKDNPASLRVMQKNGGRVVGEDEGHFFVRIQK